MARRSASRVSRRSAAASAGCGALVVHGGDAMTGCVGRTATLAGASADGPPYVGEGRSPPIGVNRPVTSCATTAGTPVPAGDHRQAGRLGFESRCRTPADRRPEVKVGGGIDRRQAVAGDGAGARTRSPNGAISCLDSPPRRSVADQHGAPRSVLQQGQGASQDAIDRACRAGASWRPSADRHIVADGWRQRRRTA